MPAHHSFYIYTLSSRSARGPRCSDAAGPNARIPAQSSTIATPASSVQLETVAEHLRPPFGLPSVIFPPRETFPGPRAQIGGSQQNQNHFYPLPSICRSVPLGAKPALPSLAPTGPLHGCRVARQVLRPNARRHAECGGPRIHVAGEFPLSSGGLRPLSPLYVPRTGASLFCSVRSIWT